MSRETGDDSLFSFPRRRRMTQTHAVLWTVIVVATTADIVLTMTGLNQGLQEGNVVVHTLVAGWTLLSDRKATVFLALFAIVTFAVVVNNVVLLFLSV